MMKNILALRALEQEGWSTGIPRKVVESRCLETLQTHLDPA